MNPTLGEGAIFLFNSTMWRGQRDHGTTVMQNNSKITIVLLKTALCICVVRTPGQYHTCGSLTSKSCRCVSVNCVWKQNWSRSAHANCATWMWPTCQVLSCVLTDSCLSKFPWSVPPPPLDSYQSSEAKGNSSPSAVSVWGEVYELFLRLGFCLKKTIRFSLGSMRTQIREGIYANIYVNATKPLTWPHGAGVAESLNENFFCILALMCVSCFKNLR